MDVVLGLLMDRATVGASTLRCARVPNHKGTVSTMRRDSDGERVPYSTELICRVASAPAVGATITIGSVTGKVGATSVYDTTGPWMRHARVYVTTRTDVVGVLTDEVTLYPTEDSTDAYGTLVRKPSTTGVERAARIEPTSASEDHSDGQRRAQTWTLTTDGDLSADGVDAFSAVECAGVRYALVGDPLVRIDPTGESWSTAILRRVGDGAA